MFVGTNIGGTKVEIGKEIKQKKFESTWQKAFVNLMYTSNWFRDLSKQHFKQFGLTSQQYNVLRILNGSHPQPLSAGDVKSVMLDKSPDLTRLVDRMEKKGWVLREICPENRRQVNIFITDAGKEMLEKIEPSVRSLNKELYSLTEEEAEQLSRLLDKMRG